MECKWYYHPRRVAIVLTNHPSVVRPNNRSVGHVISRSMTAGTEECPSYDSGVQDLSRLANRTTVASCRSVLNAAKRKLKTLGRCRMRKLLQVNSLSVARTKAPPQSSALFPDTSHWQCQRSRISSSHGANHLSTYFKITFYHLC